MSDLAVHSLPIAMNLVAAYIRQPFQLPEGIDHPQYSDGADYLAALIVAYMALHEVAHVSLCHGREQSYAAFLRSHLEGPTTEGDAGQNPFADLRLNDGRRAQHLGELGLTSSYPSFELRLRTLNESYGTAERKKVLSMVLPFIAARSESYRQLGGSTRSDMERDRDVQLFETLMGVLG